MAIHSDALEAMDWARGHVPEVIKTFMRVWDINQDQLGEGIGLSQRQISRRLSIPDSLSQGSAGGPAQPPRFRRPS